MREMATIAATAAASHTFHSLLAPASLKPSDSKSPFLKPSFPKSPSRTRSLIKAEIEIRVCVNKSCSRLGSRRTLETLSDLAPPDVTVKSCGCLGRCGAGPNLVVLPEAAFIGNCGTAARASELMASLCGGGWDPSKSLAALALRKMGEGELEKGNYSEAEVLLSQAIDIKPSGGLHIIHKCRSAARLALGNYSSALEDAKEASRIAPSYPQAYICQGDAFLAMDEFGEAENAYSHALSVDPSIRRSKSFKARVAKLQEKLTTASISS
eukprot:TRINITY_DN3746_c0_g1_i6.p1 TRINITY_DN3746_c0_g1~~TRINITY_DN3746_c0_g1_i6.p1  ORF type:complete len:268 (-),score=50.62 TRINITY_DN3746_c0_g1_i6:268-1071(-)